MPYGINYVTVIGAGTMGAAIAGHLANAGVPVALLDIVPPELTPEESAAGLTLADGKVRNRYVDAGFARMVKAKPSNLFTASSADLITLGNLRGMREAGNIFGIPTYLFLGGAFLMIGMGA